MNLFFINFYYFVISFFFFVKTPLIRPAGAKKMVQMTKSQGPTHPPRRNMSSDPHTIPPTHN